MLKRFLIAAILVGSPALRAQEARITPLLQQDLTDIPGKEGLMLTVEYKPGQVETMHRHNAHVFVYLLEGSVVMQVKGKPQQTLHVGDTFYEGPNDIHLVGRNASQTAPAKFLVFFVKDKGALPVLSGAIGVRRLVWAPRIVLAAIFLFFGSNLIFQFLSVPSPTGLAEDFRSAMVLSGFLKTVGALQVLGGLLLLFDITVPLGLVVLGPIIVNIVLYHLHFHVPGLPLVGLCVACEAALLLCYRANFAGIFRKGSLS